MILIYDGTKTWFIESINKNHPMTSESFMAAKGAGVQSPVIMVESTIAPGAAGTSSILLGIPVGKAEDRTVLLNFSAVNLVWIRDVSTEEVAKSGLLTNYINPVWEKVAKLIEEENNKRQELQQKLQQLQNNNPPTENTTAPAVQAEDNLTTIKQQETPGMVVGSGEDLV